MVCEDPLLAEFRASGYNVVRVPTASFTPLLLLESDGRRALKVIGPVGRELAPEPGNALPVVHHDEPAADITIMRSRQLKSGLAASVLSPIFGALGIAPEVGLSYGAAGGIAIVLRNVLRDSVYGGDVARFFEGGVLTSSTHVQRLAEDERLFLVTAVLKSASFATASRKATDGGLKVAVPQVAGAVTVKVEGDVHQQGETIVSFSGSRPLSFAFQAVKLLFQDGSYVDYATQEGLIGYELPTPGVPPPGALVLEEGLCEVDL